MICKKCGTELSNDATVCPVCKTEYNKDVFKPKSDWIAETSAKNKNIFKKISIFSLLTICVVLLCMSYLSNLLPKIRSYNQSLPPFAAIENENGDVSIINTNSNKVLVITDGDSISDIMINAKEDRLFFIVTDNGRRTLFSRYLSTLIYDNDIVASNVCDYLINYESDTVAYKTNSNILYVTDSKGLNTKEISKQVDEYYLSYNGKIIVYTVKDHLNRSSIYLYKDGASTLVCGNAEILRVYSDLKDIYFSYAGGLFCYDTSTEESKCISADYGVIAQIYRDEGIVYFTSAPKPDGRVALYCYDGEQKTVTSNLSSIVYTAEKPFVVYTETNERGEPVYKAIVETSTERISTINGSNLESFMLDKSGKHLFYNDCSKEQSMLVSARVKKNALVDFSVIDTDVVYLCGLIESKPLYAKNFSSANMVADLYYEGEEIFSTAEIYDYAKFSSIPHMLRPETFKYFFTEDDQTNIGEAFVTMPLRGSDAFIFSDGDHEKVYKFDGDSVKEMVQGNIEEMYMIAHNCIISTTDGKIVINKNDESTEIDGDAVKFIYIEPYGNKEYQLH